MSRLRGLATMAVGVTAGPAVALAADAPIGGGDGLLAGLSHPFAVPEHVLALVAIGLLVGQQPEGRGALAATFAAGLVAGLTAIALAAGPSHANEVLIVGAAVGGLAVALARPLPPLLGWPLAAVTGAAIGLDSPPEVVDLRVATAMLVGIGLTALVLPMVIAAAVGWLERDWQRVGVRVAGSWEAAAAIMVLALRLAQ